MDSLKKPDTHLTRWIEAERVLIAKGVLLPKPSANSPAPPVSEVLAPDILTPDPTAVEEDTLKARGSRLKLRRQAAGLR